MEEIENIKQLLEKYFAGRTSLAEEESLTLFFQNPDDLGELEIHRSTFLYNKVWQRQEAPTALKSMLLRQFEEAPMEKSFPLIPRAWVQAAATILLCILAFGWGRISHPALEGKELTALQSEVKSLRTMMMMALMEKPRASERIRAVQMVENIEEPALEAIELLIKAMNEDDNINVRLASIEVLFAFKHLPAVQEALLSSLPKQESPMIQLELLRLLKDSEGLLDGKQLQDLLSNEELAPEIRQQLQQLLQSI